MGQGSPWFRNDPHVSPWESSATLMISQWRPMDCPRTPQGPPRTPSGPTVSSSSEHYNQQFLFQCFSLPWGIWIPPGDSPRIPMHPQDLPRTPLDRMFGWAMAWTIGHVVDSSGALLEGRMVGRSGGQTAILSIRQSTHTHLLITNIYIYILYVIYNIIYIVISIYNMWYTKQICYILYYTWHTVLHVIYYMRCIKSDISYAMYIWYNMSYVICFMIYGIYIICRIKYDNMSKYIYI